MRVSQQNGGYSDESKRMARIKQCPASGAEKNSAASRIDTAMMTPKHQRELITNELCWLHNPPAIRYAF